MDRPQLPEPFESELTRLLDGPDEGFWPGVAKLCQQHPDQEEQIRRLAEAIAATPRAEPTATYTPLAAKTITVDVKAGDRIGPFSILSEIGHGGMGSVFLAEQKKPVHRRVALKVIKLGMDTRGVLARFEAERQALARMDHPHIAKVFEAGATAAGRPYFAMEYVKGVPITRYCDDQKLSLDERLRLFQQVCSGVQHAHGKGVIHRDLTPNNVLVMLQDGKPSAKIIDFGLARATDHRLTEMTVFTEQGVILGTPEYMSPEQAGLDALDVDVRSDVYTLGVLLYELLTGRLPFEAKDLRAAGWDAMCKTIRESDPQRPSTKVTTALGGTEGAAKLRRTDAGTLLRRLRGDLDWVVMKCLEKDRTRRYETATELAADVQRHLDCEPVLAHAPSAAYRLAKFARRHRTQLAATGLVFVALIVGLSAALWQAGIATRTAEENASLAREMGILAAAEQDARRAAQSNADRLLVKVRDFNLLAGVVQHGQALAEERSLHPPWPQRAKAMEDWLHGRCGPLLEKRAEIASTMANLREQAVPATQEQARREMETHPRFEEWQRLGRRVGALRYAESIRAAKQTLQLRDLPPALANLDATALMNVARVRVSPKSEELTVQGEEAIGLAAATAAAEMARGSPGECIFLSQLSLALLANGQDSEARRYSSLAIARAPDKWQKKFEAQHRELETLIERARTMLDEAERAYETLSADVMERRTIEFTADNDASRFLYETLYDLSRRIDRLATTQVESVRRRLVWARQISVLTRGHPMARTTWAQVREAIARADGQVASETYRGAGIELRDEDVMGLVPIGMNPVTRLWEFYELRSAWDGFTDPAALPIPEHESDGSIAVGDDTGIVFVLLPGGSFVMGAVRGTEPGPNVDPGADDNEGPLRTTSIRPFFLARHELTQGQWARLWDGDADLRWPSRLTPGQWANSREITAAHPVNQVDWSTCDLLTRQHGLGLPSEQEWEYACRAGTTTPWWPGPNEQDLVGKESVAATGAVPHNPVGCLVANPFGLFDMHGSVMEWCCDTSESELHSSLRIERSHRGGSDTGPASRARSSSRYGQSMTQRSHAIGMRAKREVRAVN